MKRAARARNSDLIQGTGFSNDPKLFEVLKDEVYPAILKDRAPAETIRVWVPGCSTGEDAYSHAIALREYLEPARGDLNVQIFATDLSETVIDTARWGIYPERACHKVDSTRLQRFFKAVKRG